MIVASRLLAVCCVALLVAGAAGAIGISPKATGRPPSVTLGSGGVATTTATTAIPSAPSAPAAAPADSAGLAGGLLQPADMGGYYHSAPTALSGLIGTDPCLGALQPSPAQAGRAAEGLVTGDQYQVPQIVEIVTSYSGSAPKSVYAATVAAINACGHLHFQFDGVQVSGPLAPEPLATSADAATAWKVPFLYLGQALDLQMALVRQGQNVMFVGWADTASPSPAIMGGFTSTVTTAIGAEA